AWADVLDATAGADETLAALAATTACVALDDVPPARLPGAAALAVDVALEAASLPELAAPGEPPQLASSNISMSTPMARVLLPPLVGTTVVPPPYAPEPHQAGICQQPTGR